MIKQMAWNTFKNTGNINSYLEFIKTENVEKEIEKNLSTQEEKNVENIYENIEIKEKSEKKWEL